MAGKASKKQVQTNIKILNDLYKLSLPIIVLSLLRAFYSKSTGSTYVGTSIKWLLLNAPLLISIYVIELSGRPKVQRDSQTGSKKIIKEGLDLSQSDGLLQYLFDLIYLSLFGNIGKILFNTNKIYYILFLCPIYLCFKLYGLKQQYFGSNTKKQTAPIKEDTDNKDTKSKRQMKREKKGDNQVKYKYR